MGLDFKNAISRSIEAKKSQQDENKVQRLEDRIKELETLQENIQKSISGNVTKVKYHEIKIRDNIRDDIEPEMIESLAISILEKGQLQPVLITSDRCLISGYRRYNSILLLNEPNEYIKQKINDLKKDVPQDLIAYSLDKRYDEINADDREELQFIENDERKSLDNFEIGDVFFKQKEKGLSQDEIAKRFNKTKGYVSSILSLRKIDKPIIKLLKEIQIYGCSKAKFLSLNDEEKLAHEKNKGIIGWNYLYKIASAKELSEQKKLFLNSYKSLLSPSDFDNGYFELEKKANNKNSVSIKLKKNTDNLKKDFSKLIKKADKTKLDKINKILSYIDEINLFIDEIDN